MQDASDLDHPGARRADRATSTGPTVLRIGLGGALRRLRESRGLSREDAGQTIRASGPKMSRLELGRVGFKIRDVEDLLTLYGVTDPAVVEEFTELARRANEPGWWHRYADLLPAWFETYLGLEQAAQAIRTYELQFIPGLLQTPDYARAVICLSHTQASEIDRRVDLLAHRQQVLEGPDAPRLWAVIDESALRRWVSRDPGVLRGQLEYLIKMVERPNISLQFVPLGRGGYAAAGTPFTLLRFAQPDLPDVVYLEQLTSALYLDKPADVNHYMQVMDRLVITLRSPHHSAAILRRIHEEISAEEIN